MSKDKFVNGMKQIFALDQEHMADRMKLQDRFNTAVKNGNEPFQVALLIGYVHLIEIQKDEMVQLIDKLKRELI